MDPSQPRYTQDEVNEILKRALAGEAGRERVMSHDDLVEIAAEAGIDPAALDRAIIELASEHSRALARQNEAAEISAERQVQLKRFGASLASLGVLNGFFYYLSTSLVPGTWFAWPLLGSGVVLALRLRHVIFPYDKVQRRRRQDERQRERERRRQERDAWKRKLFGGRGGEAAGEGMKRFENVVQAGVSALLAVAERKLAEHKAREQAESRKRDE